jgi:hypothetical protein
MDDSFCTESRAAPVADFVAGIAVPLVGLVRLTETGNSTEQSRTERVVAVTSVLVLSGIELVSSSWGYYTTERCRQYTTIARRSERSSQAPLPIPERR